MIFAASPVIEGAARPFRRGDQLNGQVFKRGQVLYDSMEAAWLSPLPSCQDGLSEFVHALRKKVIR